MSSTNTKITYASAITDTGFRQLFSDPEVAKDFINSILPELKIKSLIVKSEALPVLKEENSRQTFMDFHIETEKGEHVIIEMQAKRHIMFDERAVFYMAGTFFNQNNLNDSNTRKWYVNLKKVISIQLLDFDTNLAQEMLDINAVYGDTLFKRKKGHELNEKQYLKDYVLTDKITGQTIEIMRMIQVELPRANAILKLEPSNSDAFLQDNSHLKWWLSLIKNATKFDEQTVRKAPEAVKKGFEMLTYTKWNTTLQELYKNDIEDLTQYNADINDKVKNATKALEEQLEVKDKIIDDLKEKAAKKTIRREFKKFSSAAGNGIKYSKELRNLLNEKGTLGKIKKFLSSGVIVQDPRILREEAKKKNQQIENFIASLRNPETLEFEEESSD